MMADQVIVQDNQGQKFSIPPERVQEAVGMGYTPIESQGPLRQALDTVGSTLGKVRDTVTNQLGQQLGGGPDAPWPGGLRTTQTESLGQGIAKAVVPQTPGQVAQYAVGGSASLPARLLIPPAVEGVSSYLTGDSPMETARKSGVMLSAGALGEGTAKATEVATKKYGQRATQTGLEQASQRESQGVSNAMNQVYPESATLRPTGTAKQILDQRDPVAGIVAFAGDAKDRIERNIAAQFQGRPVLLDTGSAQGVNNGKPIEQILDEIKQLKADARLAAAGPEPVKARPIQDAAKNLEDQLGQVIAGVNPQLALQYLKSNRDYDVAMRLQEISKAGTSRPGTNTQTILDTQGMRQYLQKNREDYPADTYGPVFDALNLGQGNVPKSLPMPLFIGGRVRERLPMGLGIVKRPGDQEGAQLPAGVLDILYGKLLGTLPSSSK